MGHVRGPCEACGNRTCTPISDVCSTTIRGQTGHKAHTFSPVARQPALPWQPFCAPLVGGRPRVSFQVGL